MRIRHLYSIRLILTSLVLACLLTVHPIEAATPRLLSVSNHHANAPIHQQMAPLTSLDVCQAFSAGKRGDINGDGKRNVSDIMLIVNYILGNAGDDFNTVLGDLNDDGTVNVSDIMVLVNIILGAPYDDPDNPSLPTDDPGGGDPGGGV